MPPLGLITLAALFPDHYNIKLLDLNIEPLRAEDIRWADAVFISAMLVQKTSFAKVVKLCNQQHTSVVAGGPYPTSSYQTIEGVDHFVLGEVENTFQYFLNEMEAGEAKHVYLPPTRPNISESSTPRFDLLKIDAYGSMSIQYSRGCPYKCEFCDIWNVYGNKPRLKSPETIIKELDFLFRLGWRGALFIVDDNFISHKNRVKKELLPALIVWQEEHAHAFRFFTEASINLADDDQLLWLMRKAGFNEVFIGIETPSLEALRETGKTQNLRTDMQISIRKIQEKGIGVMAGFILGFDSDTENIVDQQIRFIQQSGIPQAMIGLLEALPGTKLYKRLQAEGRILATSQGNNTHSLTTNFITKMNREKLKEGYKKILSTIYDSRLKNYFRRCSQLLDNIGPSPFFQREVHFKEIKIFLKSLFRQPLTPYGLQYLKFLIRNAIKHRSTFGEAVRFAIIGHHFHTITQETLKVEKVESELERGYQYLRDQIASQSAMMMDNSKEALHKVIVLWEHKTQMLRDVRLRIDRIHEDFRFDIKNKYYDFEERMRHLFITFKRDFAEYGITV